MDDIIAQFHKVASLDRTALFGLRDRPPATDRENAFTAAPGWVGDKWKGELLFVANFPGGGADGYRGNPTDAALYKQFRRFRDSSSGDARRLAFAEMCQNCRDAERTHNLWKVVMRPTLEAMGIAEEQAAFVNLVPFRIRENKAPRVSERLAAWNAGVAGQIGALAPRQIVALGVAAGEALTRLADLQAETIPRTNGDWYLSESAKAALERLKGARRRNA